MRVTDLWPSYSLCLCLLLTSNNCASENDFFEFKSEVRVVFGTKQRSINEWRRVVYKLHLRVWLRLTDNYYIYHFSDPLSTRMVRVVSPEKTDERRRSIALHMTLLSHASTCRSTECSVNCAKMKGLLKHGACCKIKAKGGCNVCIRVWALLQIHARKCKIEDCPVPNCEAIRERYRQLKLQQQQQQAMNNNER